MTDPVERKLKKNEFEIPEFRIEDLPTSFTSVFIAPPGYGKTHLMEYIAYRRRHVYPVGRAWIGTEKSYARFCKVFGPLFVSNHYDEDEHGKSIIRQRTCITENGPSYEGNNALNIMDDLASDSKIFRNSKFQAQFKLGSQHYAECFMLGMQYCIDMPPGVRISISYVFVGRILEIPEQEKVYKNFCGILPRPVFDAIMKDICEEHTFLVIRRRAQSNDWRDNVFYIKAEEIPEDWRFGCKEFIEWNKLRYNTSYKEKMDL